MGFSLTTFVFEIINFLVLMWLLSRIVYRPLKEGIARRRAEQEATEQAAVDALKQAKLDQAAVAEARAEVEQLRLSIQRSAMEEAAEARARLLEQAREDAAAERARAHRVLEAERDSAEAWVRETALTHGAGVAAKLLSELCPEALDGALHERLRLELARRTELANVEGDVDVTFFRVPAEERVAELRKALSAALGRSPRLTLREDPELLGGLVLRLGHLVLDASVAGHLEAFRERARELMEPEADVA